MKIVFTPQYHCGTNPIEGYWCHSKQYVRKHTDQSFRRLITLMPTAEVNFIEKHIHLKLFRRFWRTIKAYDQGKDYLEVLTMFLVDCVMIKSSVIVKSQILTLKINTIIHRVCIVYSITIIFDYFIL